jgi:hypothetical protein
MDAPVEIQSRDYWVKVVEMLQQNWALIDPAAKDEGVIVYFVHDRSGVFDRLTFPSKEAAEAALRRNGFSKFGDDPRIGEFLTPPLPPFREAKHPNGPIYSSGRFWR